MTKRNYSKQKSNIYFRTISILLIFGLSLFSVYACITINTEKKLLFKEAEETFEKVQNEITAQSKNDLSNSNLPYIIESYSNEKIFISVNNHFNNTIEQSMGNLAVSFNSYTDDTVLGVIEFDTFKNSLTKEQYNEITDYLTRKTNDSDVVYLLLCSEYFVDTNNRIHPTELQVIKTDNLHSWYSKDEVINTYKLSTNNNGQELHSQTFSRNIIDSDFILGKYKDNLSESQVVEIREIYNLDKTKNKISLGLFSYAYYNCNFSQIYQPYISGMQIDYVSTEYIYKFNVLQECAGRLTIVFLFIVISFIFMGCILSFTSWNMYKKKAELDKKQHDLTNSLAHDLKTPVFIISGYAQNLLENIKTEKRDYYAKMIIEETEIMGELVRNMLNSSNIVSDNISITKENFNFTVLINNILEEYMELGVNIDFICHGNYYIDGDKIKIKCIINNLIDNAVKYTTDKNSIVITLNEHRFEISNRCKKMKKSELKKLWEPYYMGENSPRNNGNGLGLSIVKNILDIHKFKHGCNIKDNIISFYFNF